MSQQPPRDEGAKVEGRDAFEILPKTDQSPMNKFKSLTTKLLRVNADELKTEHENYVLTSSSRRGKLKAGDQ